MPRLSVAAVVVLLLSIWGCGGGGGGGGVSTIQNATFQISWPARSRGVLVNPLTSALSVAVTLKGAASNGADVTMDIDRDISRIGEYTGTYTLTQAIRPSSSRTLDATFYAQTGEGGAVVGTATAVTTTQGTTLSMGTISLSGTIATVSVVPTTLTPGSGPNQLEFTCADVHGTTIAVTPGSASWSISSGPAYLSLTQDGMATPITNGTANVVAIVDGVSSPAAGIVVIKTPDFQNPGFESPGIEAGRFSESPDAADGWTGASVISGTVTGFGIANGSGQWGQGAQAGAQYAFLQSARSVDTDQGSCQQTLTGLIVGATYHVSFWMARRNGNSGADNGEPVSLTANGSSIFPAVPPTSDGQWKQFTTSTFTATQSSYTFKFTTEPPVAGQDLGTLLDEVHLVQTH